jgi:hypothetical protein
MRKKTRGHRRDTIEMAISWLVPAKPQAVVWVAEQKHKEGPEMGHGRESDGIARKALDKVLASDIMKPTRAAY